MGELVTTGLTDTDRAAADTAWQQLDPAWIEAFRQAFDALRTGNIAVGATISNPDGTILRSSRNRTLDTTAPAGETFGSSIAHAEINALARLPFRRPRNLTLTTTLQPCVQCWAAIRLAPIAHVRYAGPDPVWNGCNDLTPLTPWLARHPPTPAQGPLHDEIGLYGALLARLGPGHKRPLETALYHHGYGDLVRLSYQLEHDGTAEGLTRQTPAVAFAHLWPRLNRLYARMTEQRTDQAQTASVQRESG